MTIMTGLAAYTNSRISGSLHPVHANLLAISHTFAAAVAAVSTLGAFGMRCASLRSVPLPLQLSGGDSATGATWTLPLILEYLLVLLYVINSMVLGVSFGVGGTVFKSLRQSRHSAADITHDPDVQIQSTASALTVGVKPEKTQIITDMEATADGFYRRLEEEEEENGEI